MKKIILFSVFSILVTFSFTSCLADILNDATGGKEKIKGKYEKIITDNGSELRDPEAFDNSNYYFWINEGILYIEKIDLSKDADFSIPNEYRNWGVEAIVVENGIKRIPDRAFTGFGNLKAISLPVSCEELGNSLFDKFTYSSYDSSDSNTPNYSPKIITVLCELSLFENLKNRTEEWRGDASICLYDSVGKRLRIYYDDLLITNRETAAMFFPWDDLDFDNLSFGKNVKTICKNAFNKDYMGSFITNVTLPENLTDIEDRAFFRQGQLSGNVLIPRSYILSHSKGNASPFGLTGDGYTFMLDNYDVEESFTNDIARIITSGNNAVVQNWDYSYVQNVYSWTIFTDIFENYEDGRLFIKYAAKDNINLSFENDQNFTYDYESINITPEEGYFSGTEMTCLIRMKNFLCRIMDLSLQKNLNTLFELKISPCTRIVYDLDNKVYREETVYDNRTINIHVPYSLTSLNSVSFEDEIDANYCNLNFILDWPSTDNFISRDFSGLDNLKDNTNVTVLYSDGVDYFAGKM